MGEFMLITFVVGVVVGIVLEALYLVSTGDVQ